MTLCTRCHKINSSDKKYCPECRAYFAAKMKERRSVNNGNKVNRVNKNIKTYELTDDNGLTNVNNSVQDLESDLEKYLIRMSLRNYISGYKKNARSSPKAMEELTLCQRLLDTKYKL